MDAKTNIIIQLRDIWLQLKRRKKKSLLLLESKKIPSDDEKEDFKIAVEGADKVYEEAY